MRIILSILCGVLVSVILVGCSGEVGFSVNSKTNDFDKAALQAAAREYIINLPGYVPPSSNTVKEYPQMTARQLNWRYTVWYVVIDGCEYITYGDAGIIHKQNCTNRVINPH